MIYPVTHSDELGTRIRIPHALDLAMQKVHNIAKGDLPNDAAILKDVTDLNENVNKEITDLNADLTKRITDLDADFAKEITDLDADFLGKITDLRTEMEGLIKKSSYQVKVLGQSVTEYDMKVRELVIPTSSNRVNFHLPISPGVGKMYRIGGFGHGGWKIHQQDGQRFHVGDKTTKTGRCGSLSSCGTGCVEFVCTESGVSTAFLVLSKMGDLDVV